MPFSRLDDVLYSWWHRTETPRLDRVLPRLTQAADNSALWLGVGAVLWATGGPEGRRAALRGIGGIAVASAVSNGPAKMLTRRARPSLLEVRDSRRVRRSTRTSSFPSGHSASAAAFASGVALERPLLALPLGALAGGVAFSRVHVGAHYPGDVAAGVAVGLLATYAVSRVWPPRTQAAPEERAAPAEVPTATDGAGFVVLINPSAGNGDGDVAAAVREALPAAVVSEFAPDDDVPTVLREAAAFAKVLGVAGGDGTVNAGAAVALDRDLPLWVIPGGTLNHFARDLGLASVDDALDAVRNGAAGWVDVAAAEVDGSRQVFLNTASLGGYSEMVRAREQMEERLGKWPAMVVALTRVLVREDPIEVDVDGQQRRLWLLFAGNCVYSPPGSAPSWRDRLDDGLLDVRVVDAERPYARTRLIAAVLTGRLSRCPVFEACTADKLEVRARSASLSLSRDGEVGDSARSFHFAKAGRIRVYRG